MISTHDLALSFGGQKLFDEVNIKFTPGNCYGLIGANGSGKSTFLRMLSGEQEADSGSISITSVYRPIDYLRVLCKKKKQDITRSDEILSSILIIQ